MKVAELLTLVNNNTPNSIPDSTLIRYINNLEEHIYSEITQALNITPYPDLELVLPVTKTLADAATQDLAFTEFGNRWTELYEFYLYSRIALFNKDFEDYQNYGTAFNSVLDDFIRFYFSRRSTHRMNWR